MTDDSNRMAEQAIHAELVAARKRPGGLSPQSMAQCPVMCDLLGNGDPEVAHVELSHKIIELIEADDDIMSIEAACYSLGLSTEADTHLARLEEFGAKHFLDQRQARRYSDRGVLQLARLIATHWTTQTVPEAILIIIGIAPSQIGFSIQLRRQQHIDMRPAKVSLWAADQDLPTPLDVTWKRTSQDDAPWIEAELAEPRTVTIQGETTIRLVWRGETWPKFTVVLSGNLDAAMVKSETLGAAWAVTLTPDEMGSPTLTS
ncbi:MAG: hypothetical protein ACYC1E_03415 [Propionibacteriaceae bacterium]